MIVATDIKLGTECRVRNNLPIKPSMVTVISDVFARPTAFDVVDVQNSWVRCSADNAFSAKDVQGSYSEPL